MTHQHYDELWLDPEALRAFLTETARSAFELFPDGFDQGYRLQGFRDSAASPASSPA